jgi:hypothetical protein
VLTRKGDSVTAKPGREYQLHAMRTDGRVYGWIVDNSSGEVVAGAKP